MLEHGPAVHDHLITGEFDPAQILASDPTDGRCTYTCDSHTSGAWTSVLFRQGHRNDAAGEADLGTTVHPRLMITRRGSVRVHRDVNGQRTSAWLAPGRAWLIPPEEPLRYEWAGASRNRREMAMVVLPRADLRRTAAALDEGRGGPPAQWRDIVHTDDHVVDAVLAGMSRALMAGADDLYAESASTFLLHHLLVTYGSPGVAPIRVGREDARVQAVIDYLHENLHQPITLEAMAQVAGLSTFHFLRVFRLATGETPRRYLLGLRVAAARVLLANPELSVTDVGSRCGFGTASHFSTVFRRVTGVSPRTYRRQSSLP